MHLKVDTGMHRVGVARRPVSRRWPARSPVRRALALEGVCTHFPVADGASAEDRAFTAGQLERFDAVVAELAGAGIDRPVRHAANSAGAIAWPAARYDLVRCGIALYGELPTPFVADAFAAEATGARSCARC